MKLLLTGQWENRMTEIENIKYKCGYCGVNTGPNKGYVCTSYRTEASILICPNCNNPTLIEEDSRIQVPGPIHGSNIDFLPDDVNRLYNEARSCVSVNAFTASVLSCRKLLMNISVSKGAEPGKSFASYVSFLDDNNYIPPDSKDWVDHIRKKGNEATHDIPDISRDDAIELLDFTEMLLRFVYEMPGRMSKYKSE